jgi:divalent metal cation (Fe/Co/Zn/Cd) transporter
MGIAAEFPRVRLLRRAAWLAGASISWNIFEGIAAVAAGVLAGSVALTGFGIDSFVETTSAVVVAWRLRAELHGGSAGIEQTERRAAKIAGALLLMLAAYIVIDAGRRLLGFGAEAEESLFGIIVTAISLTVMPVLGFFKLKTARALGSRALRADAYETITCAWLSLTTLSGLVLNAAVGWWWADPIAALALVPLIVREGIEGLRGGCACQCES